MRDAIERASRSPSGRLDRQLQEAKDKATDFETRLTAAQAELDAAKRGWISVVETKERRVQEQIDAAMQHNEELEREVIRLSALHARPNRVRTEPRRTQYDKLNAHARQLTTTVQAVVSERKALEAEIAALRQSSAFRPS